MESRLWFGWRMAHHRFFCRVLKCPHYSAMLLAAGEEAICREAGVEQP
jgi:hypothetical protein